RNDNNLIHNIAHATRADGFATLANCESNRFLHGDGRNQLHLDGDVVAWHDHFYAFRKFNRACNIRGAEIKLWPVIAEERSVTSTLLFAQHVNFRLKLLVRRDGARLRDNLAALYLLLL